ncbi:MATE family efflux transporter [Ignatzschineria rhizosphaerae]|uniref:Multidrug-efflux transporter n=1 Tax=Ignatzschineria rhizosphaerae TaxID=2923279 RepID=A0ABY3X5Y3_9GAMM|nr:MATE family efflux transporter [Ignatzschineria rhizosphaerae]UNM96195.1 MATE family efflux transporter [Ignatzschineria rhizosphaerae]
MKIFERFRFQKDEFKTLLSLMMPILITQWFLVGMGAVDIAITGHFNDSVQASVGLGVMVWNPLLLCSTGVLMSVAIFSAHEFGRGKTLEVAKIWHNGLLISTVLILLVVLIMNFFSETLLRLIRVDETLIPGSVSYLRALSIGAPAILVFNSLRAVCDGVARPIIITIVCGIGFVVNAVLNYVLVNGYEPLGIPSFGIVGSGVGTGLTFWIMLLLLILFTFIDPRLKSLRLFRRPQKPDERLREMVKVGLPSGATLFAEVAIFSAAGLILGQFGTNVVASHQISLSITSLTFMIPVSLAMALTAMTGHRMGRMDYASVLRVSRMGIVVVIGLMVVTSLILFGARYHIPQLYNSNPEIVHMSAALIIYSIFFQLPDGLQIAANGVLRGMKDTKTPMLLGIASYWLIAFPLCYYLGVVKEMEAAGVWIGLIVGILFAAIFLNIRLAILSRRLPVAKAVQETEVLGV